MTDASHKILQIMQKRRLSQKKNKSRVCATHLCLLWQKRREARLIWEVLKREKPRSLVSLMFRSNQKFVRKRDA